MKKLLFAMTAVSTLAMAAPAAAQYSQDPYARQPYNQRYEARTDAEFNARLDQRIDMIEERLEAGIDAGTIDRNESRNIRAELRTITRLHREYALNGLTVRERQELQQRLRTMRENIRIADGDRYDRRYGANENWDDEVYTGRGGPYDSDGDGWDDRDCDRDGDIDSGGCTANTRGGLGGFLETILGQGGLRVGQRVTGDLYAVPSQYRDRYRDDSRFYYRSDGRRIYQIDARTDVVTRIYQTP